MLSLQLSRAGQMNQCLLVPSTAGDSSPVTGGTFTHHRSAGAGGFGVEMHHRIQLRIAAHVGEARGSQ